MERSDVLPGKTDQFFNKKKEKSIFAKLMLTYFFLAFDQGIQQGAIQGTGTEKPDVFTSSVKDAIQAYAFQQASFVTDTTQGTLKDLLSQAVDKGWGIQKLAQGIRTLYDDISVPRSKLIARTEMTSVINYGTFQTLKAEGHQGKQWSTVMDGRERDSHAKANGQVVPIDERFKLDGGDGMYPGDPSLPLEETAQCRCTLVAANLSEDRSRMLNAMFIRRHASLEARYVVALHREFDRQCGRILAHFPF